MGNVGSIPNSPEEANQRWWAGNGGHAQPSISVVVPIRNRWSELAECLNALSHQTDFSTFEVIVIDDGSRVPMPDGLKDQLASFPVPARLRRQVALGNAAARNQGAALAAGELVLYVDSNSILAANCLNCLMTCAANHPDDPAFQLHLLAEPDTWAGRMDRLFLAAVQQATLSIDGRIAYADTAGFAVRTSYAKKAGELFNTSVELGDGTLAMADLCAHGLPPRFVPEAIAYHRHRTPLLKYLCKHFIIGYNGGKADRIAQDGVKTSCRSSARRENIIHGLWENAAKQGGGALSLSLVFVALCLKLAGRAMYGIVGVAPGRREVLHSPVDGVSSAEVVTRLVQAGERRVGMAVTYLHGWTLVQAVRDPEFSRLLGAFDICIPDGMGVVYCMFLTRFRRIKKVTANEFFGLLLQEAANRGLKIAMIGGGEETLQMAVARLRRTIPGLEIVFCSSGYLNREQEGAVLDQLKKIDPHLVFVGRGQPLQERWVLEFRRVLPNTSFFCVGGLFDYISGRIVPTPTWIRRTGFEWLHRLLHHPNYWHKYVLGIPLLFWHIFRFDCTQVFQVVSGKSTAK
jgi:N-acetylglucosaminyldiphosphoundecaprenol N-acetyl-beta-D-mannosaminyltransferase